MHLSRTAASRIGHESLPGLSIVRMRRLLALSAGLVIVAACSATSPATSVPSTTASSPPTPAPTATTAPSTAAGTPGAYATSTFAVPLSLALVDGWTVPGETVGGLYLVHGNQDAGIMSIASITVAGASAADPRLAWPDDLYAWLDRRPEYEPAQPVDVEVDGHQGIEIDTDTNPPSGSRVEIIGTGVAGAFWLADIHERDRFIEVRFTPDTGIVIFGPAPLDANEAYWAALDELVATIRFR